MSLVSCQLHATFRLCVIFFQQVCRVTYCFIVQSRSQEEKTLIVHREQKYKSTFQPNYKIESWATCPVLWCTFLCKHHNPLKIKHNWETDSNTQKEMFLDSCDFEGGWVSSQSKHNTLSCQFSQNSQEEERNVAHTVLLLSEKGMDAKWSFPLTLSLYHKEFSRL